MEVIYVYYNQNKNSFYYTICVTNSMLDEKEKNSYGHLIVQRLVFFNDQLYDLELYRILRENEEKKKLLKELNKRKRRYKRHLIIKKIINHLIDLLYRLKSKF